MKIHFSFLLPVLFIFQLSPVFSQQPGFNRITAKPIKAAEVFTSITEDEQGYIWLTSYVGGLHKFDGTKFITYTHDPYNPNSLADNWTECISRDSANFIWVGTWGSGLDRFDPATNTFRHFRHDPNDKESILNDTISAILVDHAGKLWIGSSGGLDLFNEKTGGFTHYPYIPGDTSGLSSNEIRALYEDSEGTLWVGCGSPFTEDPAVGGLNRFNKATGKFTRYMHNPNNPNSIENNKVLGILEDSKGNFWVGTSGDGLHIMDRNRGTFTHYYYDAAHPEKLSRPPINKNYYEDHITFIKEDAIGAIWIGSFYGGINRYDPENKKVKHFGNVFKGDKIVSRDSISGFTEYSVWSAFVSKEGLLWVSGNVDATHHDPANLYSINVSKTIVPYYPIDRPSASSFYYQPNDSLLWIATFNGLIKKDLRNQKQKVFLNDPGNANSLIGNGLTGVTPGEEGKLWIAAYRDGLSQYDPALNRFINYKPGSKKTGSLSSDRINGLYMDHNKNLWIITEDAGIDKMDKTTRTFFNYPHDDNDTNSLSSESVNCMDEDQHSFWIGTSNGLDRMDVKGKEFRHYLPALIVTSICVDASGIVWAGTADSLYTYDATNDQFHSFISPNSFEPIKAVLNILEDDEKNLWISTTNAIIKINSKRDEVKMFGESYGVHQNTFNYISNFKATNGELFLGDQNGYYAFFPEQLKSNGNPPRVHITSFKIRDREIKFLTGDSVSISKAKEIKLKYNENIFSFDFVALHFDSPGEERYLFMLENYDNSWHDIGAEHKAYFSNVPPGTYIFHIKAINADGISGEKEIKIVITPPWWETWWFRIMSVIAMIAVVYAIVQNHSRNLKKQNLKLEEKIMHRTKDLKQSLEHLKAMQAQLVQQEKMASLGELTAGIAHEIQNPLNFVNNFSEVNKELLVEMKDEMNKGNIDDATAIANDVIDNEEKINHHGKRADAIVKGMLQHSRISSSQKEPTDINKLADEYLRLSYHGLRAKDKSFNATLKTDFDESIEKMNVVPQDIGRVLLNLYNNAFYAVSEKKKQQPDGYEPIVTVSTKRLGFPLGDGGKVEIKVADNGNGFPQKILDKIFQPFFTTKPTGQGTGLGLSLSYDIIKAHSGEIKVQTKEGEGAEFIILLPVKGNN